MIKINNQELALSAFFLTDKDKSTHIQVDIDNWPLELTFSLTDSEENSTSIRWDGKSEHHAHIELLNWHKVNNAATLEPIHLGTTDTTNRDMFVVVCSTRIGGSIKVEFQVFLGNRDD